jgi:hypothetical protein
MILISTGMQAMRRNAWLLVSLTFCVPPLSAQTASTPPAAQTPPASSAAAAPGLVHPEQLLTFDNRQVQVRWIDQRWQLMAGDVLLKDFGRRQGDAQAALRTIQNFRLNQRGTVGSPLPVMEYWLIDGQGPQGFLGAGRVETLDLSSLRVEEVEGQWCLRDNRHRLFAFGPHREEANQALAVIRKYGFTHLAAIGPANPTMLYFLSNDRGLSRNRFVTPEELRAGILSGRKKNDNNTPPETASADEKKTGQENALPSGRSPGKDKADKQKTQPERLAFDYRQVQLRREHNEWKLVFGSYVFASFGEDQYTAQQALSLFQYYRFTEQILIGQPVPTFSYFLVAGQPPRGLKFSVPAESFFPEAVAVRQLGNQWLVCENERPLVNFGDKEADARQLVQAIQRYRFDHLCRLGNGPGHSLTVLIRER